MRRYPNAKKMTKGQTDKLFLYTASKTIKPAHKKIAEYAQILLPGNRDPKAIPNIINIRREMIGREKILSVISNITQVTHH